VRHELNESGKKLEKANSHNSGPETHLFIYLFILVGLSRRYEEPFVSLASSALINCSIARHLHNLYNNNNVLICFLCKVEKLILYYIAINVITLASQSEVKKYISGQRFLLFLRKLFLFFSAVFLKQSL